MRGNVHTQSIENFWSCLKRTLTGTYIAVEPFHMDGYLAEQCYRFNNRKNMNDGDRFTKALAAVSGKRLTWVQLTGKEAGRRTKSGALRGRKSISVSAKVQLVSLHLSHHSLEWKKRYRRAAERKRIANSQSPKTTE